MELASGRLIDVWLTSQFRVDVELGSERRVDVELSRGRRVDVEQNRSITSRDEELADAELGRKSGAAERSRGRARTTEVPNKRTAQTDSAIMLPTACAKSSSSIKSSNSNSGC